MPYVDPKTKYDLDRGAAPTTAGELTFLITRQIQTYLCIKTMDGNGVRYEDLAVCLGAIEGAKLDFIDRVVTPYEKKKRHENGDVWPLEILDEVWGLR
jgi:hypothetical protein